MQGYLFIKGSTKKSGENPTEKWSKRHISIFQDSVRGPFLVARKKLEDGWQNHKKLVDILPHATNLTKLNSYVVKVSEDNKDGGLITLTAADKASGADIVELRDKSHENCVKWGNAIVQAQFSHSDDLQKKKKNMMGSTLDDILEDKENTAVNGSRHARVPLESHKKLGSRPVLGQSPISKPQVRIVENVAMEQKQESETKPESVAETATEKEQMKKRSQCKPVSNFHTNAKEEELNRLKLELSQHTASRWAVTAVITVLAFLAAIYHCMIPSPQTRVQLALPEVPMPTAVPGQDLTPKFDGDERADTWTVAATLHYVHMLRTQRPYEGPLPEKKVGVKVKRSHKSLFGRIEKADDGPEVIIKTSLARQKALQKVQQQKQAVQEAMKLRQSLQKAASDKTAEGSEEEISEEGTVPDWPDLFNDMMPVWC